MAWTPDIPSVSDDVATDLANVAGNLNFLLANSILVAAAGGTVDAITATFAPAITLSDGQKCAVVLAGANTSTTPTFAPNGLTAHTITKWGGQALVPGDLPAAGSVARLQYNLANTRWELINPGSASPYTAANPGYGLGTIYQNLTKRVKYILVGATTSGTGPDNLYGLIGSSSPPTLSCGYASIDTNTPYNSITVIVPPGWYFKLAGTGNAAILTQLELT